MKTISIEINVKGDSCEGCILYKIPACPFAPVEDWFDFGKWNREKQRLPACIEAEQTDLRTENARLKKQVRGICESASKLQEPLDYGDDAASELFHRCVEQAKQILKELEN